MRQIVAATGVDGDAKRMNSTASGFYQCFVCIFNAVFAASADARLDQVIIGFVKLLDAVELAALSRINTYLAYAMHAARKDSLYS